MAHADFPGGARAATTNGRDRAAAQGGPVPAAGRPAGAPARSWLEYGVPAVIGRVREPGTLSGLAMFCLVFMPFALGHFLSSLLRNINAVLAPQLLTELALTPGQLGLLTSACFLTFALVQLPIGMALDRFGPRRVQFAMLMVAAIGTMAFAGSREFTQLMVARAVMGVGLAGCFMAAVKAISTWISPAKLPSVQGYLIAVGGLGAASSTLPVRLALQYTDWRWLFILLAGGCAIVALLIYLLAPTPPAAPPKPFTRRMLGEICGHPAFRETAGLVLLPHAVFFGIQGLWIARWLADVARFPEQAIAWLLYLGMAGVIFGAISVGMITEWAARRGIAPLTVAAAGIALFIAIQCGFVLNWRPSYQLLSVLFTLVGTITGIEYAIVAQAMPPALTGRASTCLNLFIFLAAFAVQAGFGLVVGLWSPDLTRHHPAIAYQTAFGLLVLLQLPGLAVFCWRRWTRRRRDSGTPAPSGKMAALISKEEYETGSLWPSRQRETRPD
ncbi:MFS transporter [Pseudoduganella namucuonensis]|uniref:Predicted arabinose efflux permease, MFS family n=1 Tax=Pseudoduganella namucuonensis TaxID=1035707 RepID=A0A1I7JVK1_9BURK|nr:MFS transporter [Pseudoduganella namucuonensis]SFU89207.1 Predicted arabinose efflux permease, MFS family [Pseudoduganella namucuonensis]